MEEKDKSREQLIQELEDTRRRLARMESEGSERQVMDAVLRESEERFRTIFDSSLDIILIIDAESRKFLGGNTVAQKVLGYTSQELRNLRVMDIHPKAEVPRIVDLFEKMIRRETFVGENIPVQCKDGRVFYADLMSSVITLAGKQYLLGIFRDLTEIKRMEDKVKKTEEIYRTIIAHSPNYIYVNDIKGYFLDASPALLAKVGLSLEKLQKRTFLDSFTGDNLAELLAAVEQLKSGQAVQNLNIRTKTARGEVLEFEVNAVPLFEQGRATTVISMAQDVTEQKRAEKALQESEKKHKALIETTDTGYVIIDSEGRVLDSNAEYVRLTGYKALSDILGHRITEWTAPHDLERNAEEVKKCAERGFVRNLEIDYVNREGKYTPVEVNATVLQTAEGVKILTLCRDISTRKQSAEALKTSEERYRSLVNHIPDIIWTNDSEGNTIYISPNIAAIYGYTQEEIYQGGKSIWLERIHPEDRDKVWQSFSALFTRKLPYNLEYRIQRKDGNWIWLHTRSTSVYEKAGVTYADGIFSDITQHKQAELALHRSEESYRSLVTNIPDIIWTTDREGNTTYISSNILDVYGFTQEEIYRGGNSVWLDRVHPEDLERVRQSFRELFAQKHPYDIEYRIRHKNGNWIWLHDRSTSVYEKAGVNYADGIFSDITRRKQAELALQESEERYRLLVDVSEDMIFSCNTAGNFNFVNPAMIKYMGWTREEFLTLNGFDLVHPEDRETVLQATRRVLENQKTDVREYRHLTKSGSYINVSVSASIIYGKEGKPAGLLGIARNITDRKIAEEKLRQAYDDLENRVTQRTQELSRANQGLRLEIAERQRAENALRESENMYRTLVEASPDVIAIIDLEGRILDISKVNPDQLGVESLKQLIGQSGFDFLSPDNQEKAHRFFQKILDEGFVRNVEYEVPQPGGISLIIELNAALIKDADGKPKCVISTTRDITEKKRSEEALRESEEMYRSLTKASPDAVVLTDLEGRILEASERALELSRYSSTEEIRGINSFDMLAPECQEPAMQGLRQALETGVSRNLEFTFIRKDKSTYIGALNVALIRDAQGKPKGLIGTIRDITERRQIEQALQKSEEMFRTLAETSSDAIVTLNLEANLVSASPRTLEMFGYQDISQEIGKSGFDWIAPDDRDKAIAIFQNALDQGFARDVELKFQRKDKSQFVGELNAAIIKDRQGHSQNLVVMVRDVTERKQIQDLLYAQRDLGVALSAINNLDEAMRLCLESVIQASGMDCGAIYLADEKTRALDLVFSRGLSPDFVATVSHLDASAPNTLLVMKGKSIFSRYLDLGLPYDKVRLDEGLRAMAVVPIFFENRVIACLNISSHVLDDIPMMARHALASISVQIGNAIARIKAEKSLRESEEMYRTLTETSSDAVGVTDMDGTILQVSPRSVEMLNARGPEEIIGTNGINLLVPEDREEGLQNLVRANIEGSALNKEYTFVRRDQSRFSGEMNAVLLKDYEGNSKNFIITVRDITERKLAEAELVRIQKAVESSGEAIGLSDSQGRHFYQNKAFSDLFGYSVNEIGGPLGAVAVFTKPEDGRKVFETIMRGDSWKGEVEMTTKDGRRIPVIGRADAIKDNEGNIIGLIGIFTDITERKRAVEALRESEEMYRTLTETSSDAVVLTDINSKVISVSKVSLELFGAKSMKEAIGMNIYEAIAPEEIETGLKNREKLLREGSLRNIEYQMRKLDGTGFIGEVNTTVVRDSLGKPKGFFLAIRDITDRKRAEEAIRKSEEMFRTLVHTSPDAIIVTDLQGRVIEASQKNLELTGYQDTRELVGSDGFKGIAPEDREKAAKVYQKILKDGFARNVEYTLMRKDGSRFLGEINAALLKDAEGKPQSILAVIRDITERKRLEKEILEVSAREQRRIGQDLHDGLSQHLTAISFMNKSLENKLAAKSPAEAQDAAKISQLVSQAITQTRSLARGLYPVEHRADGLMSSLKQLTINLESMFKISCLFQCNKRIFIEDNLISTNLYYIAQEAANNAIKHGKAKHVKIRLSSVKNKLTMTVSDDGTGIPKNLKANGGMGLQIMGYRSKLIGASFNVQPGRKGGTLVTCSLNTPPKNLH